MSRSRNFRSEKPLDPFCNPRSPRNYDWRAESLAEVQYYVFEPFDPRPAAICARTLRRAFNQSYNERLGEKNQWQHGDVFRIAEPYSDTGPVPVSEGSIEKSQLVTSTMDFRLVRRSFSGFGRHYDGFTFQFLTNEDVKRYLKWWPSLEITW